MQVVLSRVTSLRAGIAFSHPCVTNSPFNTGHTVDAQGMFVEWKQNRQNSSAEGPLWEDNLIQEAQHTLKKKLYEIARPGGMETVPGAPSGPS